MYPQAPAPPPNLRITFPPPGFFLLDARLLIVLDNAYPLYDGSFKQGLDTAVPVAPGYHQLTVHIAMSGITRNRVYPINVAPGRTYSVLLEYSRLWGNFASSPKIFER